MLMLAEYRAFVDNIRKQPGPFCDQDTFGTEEALESFEKIKIL